MRRNGFCFAVFARNERKSFLFFASSITTNVYLKYEVLFISDTFEAEREVLRRRMKYMLLGYFLTKEFLWQFNIKNPFAVKL